MKRGVNIKAQITLFVILGILVLSLIFLSVNVIKKNTDLFIDENVRLNLENIRMNLFLCLDETSLKGLDLLGLQGGYYNKPRMYFNLGEEFIPYYYYEGDLFLIDKEKVTLELESYIEENIGSCFSRIEHSDFKLVYDKPDVNVLIGDKEIIFELENDFFIENNTLNLNYKLDRISFSQRSNLNNILEVAKQITSSHEIDNNNYCISCFQEIAKENNVYIDFLHLKNNTVLVVIGDNETSNEAYLFTFMNKYIGNESSSDFKLTGDIAENLAIGGFS